MLHPSIISGASQEKLMDKHGKAVYIEMQKLLGLFGDQSQISKFIFFLFCFYFFFIVLGFVIH